MKKALIVVCCVMCVIGGLFALTDPRQVPAFILVVPFVLLFLIFYEIIMAVMVLWRFGETGRRPVALLSAGTITLLLVLQSLGQLTVRDAITIVAIFVIMVAYTIRTVQVKQ